MTEWFVPSMLRFNGDQKPSIVFVWTSIIVGEVGVDLVKRVLIHAIK